MLSPVTWKVGKRERFLEDPNGRGDTSKSDVDSEARWAFQEATLRTHLLDIIHALWGCRLPTFTSVIPVFMPTIQWLPRSGSTTAALGKFDNAWERQSGRDTGRIPGKLPL